jgi:hypothetical protein
MWSANGKAIEAELPKPIGTYIIPPFARQLDMFMLYTDRKDVTFSLWGFVLSLVPLFLSTLSFLPFGMGMFIWCCYIFEVCNFHFDFTGV